MKEKVIEQIKDSYGNLIQFWGIYEVTNKVEKSNTYVRKSSKKKLLGVYDSLKGAEKRIK